MVYAMAYRPKASSYPSADILEGNTGELELEDITPDGGTGLQISRSFSGRRAKPDSVPKTIRWNGRRKLLDYETTHKRTVSPRFRDLIEAIEPGVHQFVPVEFVAKDGSPLATRWFWQVCNRLDSVHRERTNYVLDRGVWRAPNDQEHRLVFDLETIGDAKFWHDKHEILGPLIIDAVKDRLEAGGMTGIHYHHYEDA